MGLGIHLISVADIAGRVVERLVSIATGLVMGMDALGMVEKGVGCRNVVVDAGAGSGINSTHDEWMKGDHLATLHSCGIEASFVVAIMAGGSDDSDAEVEAPGQ